MKKLILLLCACIALPVNAAMMRRAPKINVDAMLQQLKEYEKLDFSTMSPAEKGKKSDEVNDLIGRLKEAEVHGKDRAKIEKAIKDYQKVQAGKEAAYRKRLKEMAEQAPLEAR